MCLDRKCLWGCCCCFENMTNATIYVMVLTIVFAIIDILDCICMDNDLVTIAWIFAASAATFLFSGVLIAGVVLKQSYLVGSYVMFYMASVLSDTLVIVLKETKYVGLDKDFDSNRKLGMLLIKLFYAFRIPFKLYFVAVAQSGYAEVLEKQKLQNV